MPTATIPTIFDGHNDVLLELYRGTRTSFFERSQTGHLDLPRAREGNLGGGFCAVFVPPQEAGPPEDDRAAGSSAAGANQVAPTTAAANERTAPADPQDADRADLEAMVARFRDETTMPPTPELGYAQQTAMAMMALLFRIEAEGRGQVRVVRTVADLQNSLEQGIFATILHFEGAEAIDRDLNALEVFCRAGLRSLGLVWSRPNAFAHGVPFKFPSSPDTGPGLTEAGRALVQACNRLGVMIDLSHLNEQGFWDVARLSTAPLVATHSNAYALSPSARNLTDRQLAAIKESDGMVGVNFHVGFLREDGEREPDTPLDVLVRHVDYLVEHVGIERVGFGSDFDGATMPRDLGDAAGLPRLITRLREQGYEEAALRKLCHENWVRVLRLTWGA